MCNFIVIPGREISGFWVPSLQPTKIHNKNNLSKVLTLKQMMAVYAQNASELENFL